MLITPPPPPFRPQAAAAAGDLVLGHPIALMPWSWWVLLGFLLSFAVLTTIFLATAAFPRKEAAAGILRFSRGEVRIAAPHAGTVATILVRDGQHVGVGDLLAFITTEQLFAGGAIYDAQVLAAVARERAMLEDRLAALNTAEPLQAASLRERIAGLSAQLRELGADKSQRAQRLRVSLDSLDDAASLVRQGIYGAERYRASQQQMLALQQAVTELNSQIAALESQRMDLSLQLARLPADTAQSRASILQEIAGLEERRANATAQNGFSLVARAAGIVTALQAQIGDPVDATHPLMAIIPDGNVLQAEIFVPSRAAGFIEVGQKVRLLYDAFPYTRFGPGFGSVEKISTAVLRPEEVAAAVRAKEPVYRVVVRLQDTAMHAYGREMPLQSGMALQADILLEMRSFLDLLLDPLRAAGGRILGT